MKKIIEVPDDTTFIECKFFSTDNKHPSKQSHGNVAVYLDYIDNGLTADGLTLKEFAERLSQRGVNIEVRAQDDKWVSHNDNQSNLIFNLVLAPEKIKNYRIKAENVYCKRLLLSVNKEIERINKINL